MRSTLSSFVSLFSLLILGTLTTVGCGSSSATEPEGQRNSPNVVAAKLVAVGGFGCALFEGDRVACFESMSMNGELGALGPQAGRTRVIAGLTRTKALAVGARHACALDEDGAVRCWGSNAWYQLGHARGSADDAVCMDLGKSVACNPTPQLVEGLPKAVAIHAYEHTTCALAEDGRLLCFGRAQEWQQPGFGLETAGKFPCGPTDFDHCDATPREVLSVDPLGKVVFSRLHRCVADASGVVTCKGRSDDGGAGCTASDAMVCTGVVDAVKDPKVLGAGESFTCALGTDGAVQCFGRNDNGQLGHAPWTSGDREGVVGAANPLPTAVAGLAVTSLATGAWSSCVIDAGAVLCWGSNGNARLGHERGTAGDRTTASGTGVFNATPTRVPGIVDAASIAVGDSVACTIRGSGALWCWGGPMSAAPHAVEPTE